MIPIKELRVGSKVSIDNTLEGEINPYKDYVFEVVLINNQTEVVTSIHKRERYSCFVDSLEPIPITEEHLIELGFEKHKETSNSYSLQVTTEGVIIAYIVSDSNNRDNVGIELETISGDAFMYGRKLYLHQLQNLITDLK